MDLTDQWTIIEPFYEGRRLTAVAALGRDTRSSQNHSVMGQMQ